MLTIINILISAYLFCYRGRGGKFWYFAGMIILIGLQVSSPWELIGWVWILAVMGSLPTHGLFSAIHGNPPGRKDHKYLQWIAQGAEAVAGDDWFKFGRYYGFLRAVPAIPAFLLVGNPFLLALLFHGDIYYFAGTFAEWFRVSRLNLWLSSFACLFNVRYYLTQSVIVAECLTGALMGGLI